MPSIFHAFLAQTADGGGLGGQAGGSLVMMALIVGVFYFLVIRPQSKQQKQHASYLSSLKKGDEVVTQGGILGRVVVVDDRTVTLDVGGGTKLRVLKTNVSGAFVEKGAAADGSAKKKDEKAEG
jgi:preprotein translocase subunit YajC